MRGKFVYICEILNKNNIYELNVINIIECKCYTFITANIINLTNNGID